MYLARWWDITRLRLRSLLLRRRLEHELVKELRFHVESETEANLRLGLPPSEAQLAAVRRLGGVAQIQEECREMRRTSFLRGDVFLFISIQSSKQCPVTMKLSCQPCANA